MVETKDTAKKPAKKPAKPTDSAESGPRLEEVFVVLTGGGRLLGDRHYTSAEKAAEHLQASAVTGVILPAQVLAADQD